MDKDSRVQISIIMPCYNAGQYIEEAIQSIMGSSIIERCELVLVNDGSFDETESIVMRLMEANPDIQIKYKRIMNSGVSTARNVGIDMAEGEYIVFIDADDKQSPRMLEALLKGVKDYNADIAFCQWTDKESKLESINIEPRKIDTLAFLKILLYRMKPVGLWSVIFKKEMIDQNNIRFSNTVKYGEDLQFLWQVAIRANAVAEVSAKYYYYRPTQSSAMKKVTWRKVEIIDVMQQINDDITKELPAFSKEFNSFMVPRTLLSLLKDFAQSGSKEYFDKIGLEYDCKKSIRKINSGGVLVIVSAKLYCISPTLFFNLFHSITS